MGSTAIVDEDFLQNCCLTLDAAKGCFIKFLSLLYHDMSLVMRKPAFCISENKAADQLRSNCAADQRLCFRYTDSTIPLIPNFIYIRDLFVYRDGSLTS